MLSISTSISNPLSANVDIVSLQCQFYMSASKSCLFVRCTLSRHVHFNLNLIRRHITQLQDREGSRNKVSVSCMCTNPRRGDLLDLVNCGVFWESRLPLRLLQQDWHRARCPSANPSNSTLPCVGDKSRFQGFLYQ